MSNYWTINHTLRINIKKSANNATTLHSANAQSQNMPKLQDRQKFMSLFNKLLKSG